MATYVRPRESPNEFLAPALGHIGYVVRQETRTVFGKNKGYDRIPALRVRFLIDGQERLFCADAAYFTEIPASEVPKDLRLALSKPEEEAEAALKLADKTFRKTEKERQRALRQVQAEVENIWEASRRYWRAWKGVNGKATGIPSDSKDPQGVDASNRPTPKIT